MSTREKILAGVIAALVGVFLLDWLVIGPAWSYLRQQGTEARRLETDLEQARLLVDNADIIEARWSALTTAGLGATEEVLRTKVQQNLSVWSGEAGFDLTTLVSGRTVDGDAMHEVQFVVSGSGSLNATVDLLDAIQRSPFPLRIVELDLTSRDEDQDRVSLRATLSTARFAGDEGQEGGRS